MHNCKSLDNTISESEIMKEDCETTNKQQHKGNGSSPSSSHTLTALWHGLGLFGESYLLFSVGTLRPFWETLYPSCFDMNDKSECAHPYLSYKSITYSVVLGVMFGMVVLGILANSIGRRKGSIITASLMAFGSMLLTLASIFLASTPSILFPAMSCSLFIFGIGVGGEYPLSASSASERAMIGMKKRQLNDVEHSHKMKRLLLMNSNSEDGNSSKNESNPSCQTPIHGNRKKDNNDAAAREKQTSLLEGQTITPPWQTLDANKPNSFNKNNNNNNLSIHTSSRLTPVTETYYSSGLPDVPLSPTNITKDTNNSLSSFNTSLRTRGREVLLVFSCQGLGIFANSLILTFLLLVTRNKNNNIDDDDNAQDDNNNNVNEYYDHSTLLNIWRITYATGAVILIYVLVSRIIHLTESEVWSQDQKKRQEERLEKHQREAGVGFKPPQQHLQHTVGPYEMKLRKDDAKKNKAKDQQQEEAVISPTMSSLTMRSEFEMLGSTNIDGCRIVPAVMMGYDDDGDETLNGKKKLSSETMLLLRHYGVRLFGTSMSWLLWVRCWLFGVVASAMLKLTYISLARLTCQDIAYYGNKLFQSTFLLALAGEDASLIHITSASALNAFIALLGYYAAACIVDDPDVGRLALQQTGFIITGTLFVLCGCLNDRISSTWLVVMYFGSSFFGQFGPNCTTFLIPAEVFPTSKRGESKKTYLLSSMIV